MWLDKKKIVIIGGTTGMGLSAAQVFVREGAQVVVVGRNPDSCAAAVYFMSDQSLFTTRQVLTVDGGWSVSEGQL